mmetsp:Transcript_1672/g.2186  ORF Transcript_1672/g.2186 Transcript_1672/m.2186 type:complete len:296 (+) Transcript_1672:319-1206(+)
MRKEMRCLWHVPVRKKHFKPRRRRKTEPINLLSIDIFDRTGLFEDDFENLYQRTTVQLSSCRTGALVKRRILAPRSLLLFGLHFLRENLKMKVLGEIYGISSSTAKRELHFILPILYCRIPRSICWPQPNGFVENELHNIAGAVDATPHFRNRVHPGSLEYYRGDLKDYFISAQLVVSLTGQIWSVIFRTGHHNDQSLFNDSGIYSKLGELDMYLAGDKGYWSGRIYSPRDMEDDATNLRHRQLRAIVERVFGYVKCWAFAGGRCRLSPEMQLLGLMIIYQLVAQLVMQFPLIQE